MAAAAGCSGGSGSSGPSGSKDASAVSACLDAYGDMHKLVLQGMMAAGYLDAKGVKKLFMGSCSYLGLPSQERTSMAYVQKVVRDINEKVRPYDMAIRSASCELTGKKFYLFLITVVKPLLKFQTLYTEFEVDLFLTVMDKILRKYTSYSVPMTQCINLSLDLETKGTLDQAEEFILRMIDVHYFAKFPILEDDFNITLGVRGIRELEPILRDCYRDVIGKCSLCKVILLHGYLCPRCRLLIHRPCFQRYVTASPQCPNCKVDWSEEGMIRRVRDEEEMEYDIDFDGKSVKKDPDGTGPPDLDVGSPGPVLSPLDGREGPESEDDEFTPSLGAMSLEDREPAPKSSGKGRKRPGRK